MPNFNPNNVGPLDGVHVLDLTRLIAGNMLTLQLADFGAEIIKIERPGPGDPRRAMPPFAEKDGVKKAAGLLKKGMFPAVSVGRKAA